MLRKAGLKMHRLVLQNWKVKQEDAQSSSVNFGTQKDAFERAREIAKNNGQEVIIHKPDGTIRYKHSYGNDPCPPRG